MICSNLIEQMFFEPAKYGADELYILSGTATSNMASLLLEKFQKQCLSQNIKNINLMVGMVGYNGIKMSNHNGFVALQNNFSSDKIDNFSCSYIYDGQPIHSNLYIWLRNGEPQIAFVGSAEFTQAAFLEQRQELMVEFDAEKAYDLYLDADNHSIYCNHAEVEDNIIIYRDDWISDTDNQISVVEGASVESVKLSLLARNNEVGAASGLNWGQRKGRNKNEAYINIPAVIRKNKFFPNDKHFTVLTDDGHFLILRTEQEQYKAITTPLSNAQLGEYFRNRLELANGAFVDTSDLINYGRTDVEFFKIDDEHYYMDFSR